MYKFDVFIELATTWAENNGHEVRDDYSGRAMYGKRCFGIVVPSAAALYDLYYHLGRLSGDLEVDLELPGTPSTDSMGRDTIVYWPNAVVEKVQS